MKINPLELFYAKNVSPLEFKFNQLRAPSMFSMLPITIDQYLYQIATHPRYSGNLKKKYDIIDKAVGDYGFQLLARGTNRSVYRHINNDDIVLKVGIDKAGAGDANKEFYNQKYLKPFCTKTFEVSPSGVIGLFERVIPFTYKDEFASIAEDIFDMLTKFVLGRFILADIGTDCFMNYGLRKGFGPVLIDYPFMYELDGRKLHCTNSISTEFGIVKCDGIIDYDAGFNHLVCEKCGKQYFASDLGKVNEYGEFEIFTSVLGGSKMAVRIFDGLNKIYSTSPETQPSFVEANNMPTNLVGYHRNVTPIKNIQSNVPKNTTPVAPIGERESYLDFVNRKIFDVLKNLYNIGYDTKETLFPAAYSLLKYIQATDRKIVFKHKLSDLAFNYTNTLIDAFSQNNKPNNPKPNNPRPSSPTSNNGGARMPVETQPVYQPKQVAQQQGYQSQQMAQQPMSQPQQVAQQQVPQQNPNSIPVMNQQYAVPNIETEVHSDNNNSGYYQVTDENLTEGFNDEDLDNINAIEIKHSLNSDDKERSDILDTAAFLNSIAQTDVNDNTIGEALKNQIENININQDATKKKLTPVVQSPAPVPPTPFPKPPPKRIITSKGPFKFIK